MANKRRHHNNNNKKQHRPPSAAPQRQDAGVQLVREIAPKPTYGKPFILLEDLQKNTFEYLHGAWVPHPKRIAECRLDCLVKELPQKLNKMTRYEVRSQVPTGA
jgi:hypothetical protein